MGCGSSQVASPSDAKQHKPVTPKAAAVPQTTREKTLMQKASEEKKTRASALVITQIKPDNNLGDILKNVPLFSHLDK